MWDKKYSRWSLWQTRHCREKINEFEDMAIEIIQNKAHRGKN